MDGMLKCSGTELQINPVKLLQLTKMYLLIAP